MDTANYDTLRHFADSWGLLYLLGIFIAVVLFTLRPGAKSHAEAAARIPLDDNDPRNQQP